MSSSWTILMTCWAGFSASDRSIADGALADAVEHPADDLEVDVRLEQGDPDLAQDLVDVLLAQAPLAPEPLEDPVEPVRQCLEHEGPMPTGA